MNSKNQKNGLNAIYIMQAIDSLGMSLSGVFVPVFLLNNGYDFRDIILYFIIHNIVLIIAIFSAGYVSSKIGLKRAIIFRFPFLFVFLLMLIFWDNVNLNYYYLAISSGLQSAFYWVPLNILFARSAKREKMGSAFGKLMAIPQIVGLFGPVIGGLIAVALGFRSLFFITFIISLVSFIPFIFSIGIKYDYEFKPKRGFDFFKKHPKLFFAEIFDNIGGEAEGLLWPVFIYLVVKDIVVVGYLATLLSIGGILFTFFIGKLSDKYKEQNFLKLASVMLIIIWVCRYFFDSPEFIYGITLVAGFVLSTLVLPYNRLLFNTAKKETNEEFYVVKEFPMFIGRMIIFILAFIFADNLYLLFPVIGSAYIYFLFL